MAIFVNINVVAASDGSEGEDFKPTTVNQTIHIPNSEGLLQFQKMLAEAEVKFGEQGQAMKRQGKPDDVPPKSKD